ncbi:hypothetical protein BN381_10293 [Candidatus Microthrix parvicella RN1]|uniref:Uncharacterized protein n=1 Tax=Candidatus Neomicrothrix parvicella RN1 TaxID=1229780 RepID=R4Z0A2_9ACTN|nr:hypothetical protein BN381_10293 [Candidatus Microthrix parvicella RN1]
MIVGPASSRPRPPGGPMAPALAISSATTTASPRERSRPNHSDGHAGTDQWASRNIVHHSPTVRSGSQLAVTHDDTSARSSELSRSEGSLGLSVLVVASLMDVDATAGRRLGLDRAVKFDLVADWVADWVADGDALTWMRRGAATVSCRDVATSGSDAAYRRRGPSSGGTAADEGDRRRPPAGGHGGVRGKRTGW